MANAQNPKSNAHVQALLDLQNLGLGTLTINQAITQINGDPNLLKATKAVWQKHLYPDKRIVYVQQGIEQRLMTLTDPELRVLTVLGMYVHQSGLIQAKQRDIATVCGLSETAVKRAIKGLISCGAIRIEAERCRHEPTIYKVNPGLYNKGSRDNHDREAQAFETELPEPLCALKHRELTSIVQTEAIRTENYLYNRLCLVSKDDLERQEQAIQKAKHTRETRRKIASGQTDGQISFDLKEEQLPWETVS